MKIYANLKRKLGTRIAKYLSTPIPNYQPFCTYDVPVLESFLQPADILLVEGDTRISTAIKYLTQSTWSHAAFYAGDTGHFTAGGEACPLIEAEIADGVIASPLSRYRNFNTRICRPVGLTEHDRDVVVRRMIDSIGLNYDLQNIFDLARYLFPTPPVPTRLRRRLLAFGSGDPSKAICSTLIAETFQSIHYPILPTVEKKTVLSEYHYSVREILHIRHYSLFTPRDFDVSPYFKVIKPTVEDGFDYRALNFSDDDRDDDGAASDPKLKNKLSDPQILILSAPSGAGKTSLARKLVETRDDVALTVSHTTRPKRRGEQHGVDYFFVDAPAFEAMIAAGKFIEHANVFGNYYGTSHDTINTLIADGKHAVLEIDWQGARAVREKFPPDRTQSVFIMPPSVAALEERLRARQLDADDVIAARMRAARDEMSHRDEYDIIITNDHFEQAFERLAAVLPARVDSPPSSR